MARAGPVESALTAHPPSYRWPISTHSPRTAGQSPVEGFAPAEMGYAMDATTESTRGKHAGRRRRVDQE